MKVYSSPASLIEFEPNKSLLWATWLPDASTLTEEEVKSEITNVLSFAKEFNIKKIIVDTLHYPFRANYGIQYWINFKFMPMIMECGVEKYAIIVSEKIQPNFESFYGKDSDDLQVEYFMDADAAQQWLELEQA